MKTITLLSRKGGSGKSTLTVHWGVEAQKTKGNRVVLIDTDPQGSCSSWYNKREAETPLLIQSNTKTIFDHNEQKKLFKISSGGFSWQSFSFFGKFLY